MTLSVLNDLIGSETLVWVICISEGCFDTILPAYKLVVSQYNGTDRQSEKRNMETFIRVDINDVYIDLCFMIDSSCCYK